MVPTLVLLTAKLVLGANTVPAPKNVEAENNSALARLRWNPNLEGKCVD